MLATHKYTVDWSPSNKFTINLNKTKEIVFHQPNLRKYILLVPMAAISQVRLGHMSATAVRNLRIISSICFQVVILQYEGGATVSFTMVGCSEPSLRRRTTIFGTRVSKRTDYSYDNCPQLEK